MEENQQNTPSQELPVTTVVETDTNDKKIKPSKITGNLVALIVVLVVALLVAVVMDIIFYMNVQSLQLMSAESVRALEVSNERANMCQAQLNDVRDELVQMNDRIMMEMNKTQMATETAELAMPEIQ